MTPPAAAALHVFRLLAVALVLVSLASSGCLLMPKTRSEPSRSGWEHSNLFNSRTPYPKLVVEIDAVEGQGPSAAELRDLEAFLREFCDKPGGIIVKVDDIIPRDAVADRPAEVLALEYLDGTTDPDTALLYVLFYNSRLRSKDRRSDHPAFSPLPHPVVWMDRSYSFPVNVWRGTFRRTILLHELGHALGLCAASSHHGAGGHCTNEPCRMNPSIEMNFRRLLTLRNPWVNRSLCTDCVQDLARFREQPASPKFAFSQGYFRRDEDGYHVLGRPGFTYIRFGVVTNDPPTELHTARQEALAGLRESGDTSSVTIEAFDPWEALPAFSRFLRETSADSTMIAGKLVDQIADSMEEAAKSEPQEVRERLSDEFLAAIQPHAAQHQRLTRLRDELDAASAAEKRTRLPAQ